MSDDMESRLMARLDAIETRITDTEARLMTRLNDGQERLSERIGAVERQVTETGKRIGAVERQVTETGKRIDALTEIARTTNTLRSTVAGLLTDFGRRITDLEKK